VDLVLDGPVGAEVFGDTGSVRAAGWEAGDDVGYFLGRG
jgi:hypothetical protein